MLNLLWEKRAVVKVHAAAAEEGSDEAAERALVGSLQRGLGVMEILAAHAGGMTLTETAEKAGLTRAGARRLLLTLAASGYAVQNGRRFSLSPKVLGLARLWLEGASLWRHAEPIMRGVSMRLGESCSAAVLQGEDVVYVARVAGPKILSVGLHVGTRLPAWCTSMGRVLLADFPPAELRAFLSRAKIEKRTAKSIAEPERLAAEIAGARELGFALVDEELEIGLRSIAVPLRDRAGKAQAAINVSTQASRFTPDEMRRDILPVLREAARQIEDYLAVQ